MSGAQKSGALELVGSIEHEVLSKKLFGRPRHFRDDKGKVKVNPFASS